MAHSDQPMSSENQIEESATLPNPDKRRRYSLAIKALALLVVFAIGGGGGYLAGSQLGHETSIPSSTQAGSDRLMALMDQVNPPEGYQIPAIFGDIGPKMIAAGAIDLAKFASLYEQQNLPLTGEQEAILTQSSQEKVTINSTNAYFLLNFFWALGLVNRNPILTEGPMVSQGIDKVGGFASTGGWTLGAKPATVLFASTPILEITSAQQATLLQVASAVYRPCCNNPTDFPDCNHGMALLGLFELMASQGASADEMFQAAKYVTAFWYPQQMLEIATAIQAAQKVDFNQADARTVVSQQVASISGFQAVHQWLGQNGLLQQAPSSGGSCGVQ